jgi:hypothetical protein
MLHGLLISRGGADSQGLRLISLCLEASSVLNVSRRVH